MQSMNWLFTLLLLSGKLIKGGKVVDFKDTLTSPNIIRKYQGKLINKNSAKVNSVKKASGAVDDITIPSVRNNEFNKWFDNLTSKQLDEVWKNPEIRKKIEDRIRRPGGYHEWHLVSITPSFKKWGVSMDDIK